MANGFDRDFSPATREIGGGKDQIASVAGSKLSLEATDSAAIKISQGPPHITGFLETPGNGDDVFHQVIASANSVKMWMYHLTEPGSTQALITAHKKPSDVEVILDQGSLKSTGSAAAAQQLQAAGVDVIKSSTGFSISHAKTMLINDTTSYITSINLTKVADQTRDFGIATDDPMIARDLKVLFRADLDNAKSGGTDTPAPVSPFLVESPIPQTVSSQEIHDNHNAVDNITANLSPEQRTRVDNDFSKATEDFSSLDQLAAEQDLIKLPQGEDLVQLFAKRMQLNKIDRIEGLINRSQTQLIGGTENLGAREIQSALFAAIKRGVDVELIVPGEDRGANNNPPNIKALEDAGAHVWVMPAKSDKEHPYAHAKYWIRDNNQEAYLGSENFTFNSLHKAREIGIIFYDQSIMQKMTADFVHDRSKATEASAS